MPVLEPAIENALRAQAIEDVLARAEAAGGFLTRAELLDWHVDATRLPLIDFSRGIRNPADFASTLSITSTANGPYDDAESPEDGLLRYAYRKGDPWSGDNAKLRNAITTGVPVILFRKEIPGILTPIAPVYVVDEEPENGCFVVVLDEAMRYLPRGHSASEEQRRYALRLARQRLHQPAFRTRVLVAYETRCAVCRLAHGSLLDAAHIVPDTDPRGVPTVPNGLAMCKIHHAAFDQQMLGITPDREVRIASDLLAEVDGPMLKHGLQEMDGRSLWLPQHQRDLPDRDLLAVRWEQFVGR